jgi:hypothetical protein
VAATLGVLVVYDLILVWALNLCRGWLRRDPVIESGGVAAWASSRLELRGSRLTVARIDRTVRHTVLTRRWFPYVFVVMAALFVVMMLWPLDSTGLTGFGHAFATHLLTFSTFLLGLLVTGGLSVAFGRTYVDVELRRLAVLRESLSGPTVEQTHQPDGGSGYADATSA